MEYEERDRSRDEKNREQENYSLDNPYPLIDKKKAFQGDIEPVRVPPPRDLEYSSLQADLQFGLITYQEFVQQAQALNRRKVAELSPAEKLAEAVNRAARKLPGEVGQQLKAMFTPQALATMVVVMGVYLASHATGAGQAFDVAMILVGGFYLGKQAFDVFKDLIGFAKAINAKTPEELDEAGECLARAVATVGIEVVMTLLTKKVADEIAKTGDRPNANNLDNTNTSHLDNAGSRRETGAASSIKEEPRQNQSVRANDNFDVADQVIKPVDEIASSIKNRINSSSDKFDLKYTDLEIDNIIQEGRKLGLDDATIEDLIFIGSRKAKQRTVSELITQMDNYVNTVSRRGYPYKFTNLEQFDNFKADLKSGLESIGFPTNDVRIQGSSLRTPNANDVDLVTLMDDNSFDKLLVDRYDNRIKIKTSNGNVGITLSNKSHDELINLSQEIQKNGHLYNDQAETFAKAMIDRFFNSKSKISKPLKRLRKDLSKQYPNLNIEAIAIQTKNGEFDLKPYLKIE